MRRLVTFRAAVMAAAMCTVLVPNIAGQGPAAPPVSIRPLVLGWSAGGPGRVSPDAVAAGPLWSSDASLVAYSSLASNLTSPGDAPDTYTSGADVYVVDVKTGHNLLVSAPDPSVAPVQYPAAFPAGFSPMSAPNGDRLLAFWSSAPRLAGEAPGTPDDLMTDPEGRYDLFLARILPDGVDAPTLVAVERLTTGGVVEAMSGDLAYRGAWSPDGTRFVFASPDESDGLEFPGVNDSDLFMLDLATRTVTRLTNAVGDATGPIWSPDGAWIAFTFASDPSTDFFDQNRDSLRDTGPDNNNVSEVYLLAVTTGAVTRVTNNTAGEAAAALAGSEALGFSPDSGRLLFSHVAQDLPGLPSPPGARQIADFTLATGTFSIVSGLVSGPTTTLGIPDSAEAAFAPAGAPARPGSLIVLSTRANNLPGLENTNPSGYSQVVVRTAPGTFTLISRDTLGNGATHASDGSAHPSVAPVPIDGRIAIAFDSDALNLDGAPATGERTIYLASILPSEGDLRLRASRLGDASDLNGRSVSVVTGTTVFLRLDLENEGVIPTAGEVRLTLPAGFSVISWDPPDAGVTISSGAIVWAAGTIQPGVTAALDVALTTPAVPGVEAFTAEVSAGDPDLDSTPGNSAPGEDDFAAFQITSLSPDFADDVFRGTMGRNGAGHAVYLPHERLLANDWPGMRFVRLVGPTYGPTWSAYNNTIGEHVRVDHWGTVAETITFQYEAADARGNQHIATVTVRIDNRVPVPVDRTFIVVPGQPLEFGLDEIAALPGNEDPDGDRVAVGSFALVDPGAFGTLEYGGDFNRLRFTPAPTYTGGYEFSYGLIEFPDLLGAVPEGGSEKGMLRFVTRPDPMPTIDFGTSSSTAEGTAPGPAGTIWVTLQRRGDLSRESTVTYTLSAGPAPGASTEDLVGGFTSGSVTFAANQALATVTILTTPDSLDEPDEHVLLTLTGATGATLTRTSLSETIRNDDLPQRSADVSVTLTAAPGVVDLLQPVTLTAVVTNSGPSPATNVVFTGFDSIVSTHLIDSITASQGSCAAAAAPNPLQCLLGTLTSGASATITVVARPTLTVFQGASQYTLTVSVQAVVRADEQEPAPVNNSASTRFDVRIPIADIQLTASVAPQVVDLLQPATITAVVRNNGPDVATNVTFRGLDLIVNTHIIDAVSVSQGSCLPSPYNYSPITCEIGTLAPGASATITVIARPTVGVFPNDFQQQVFVNVLADATADQSDLTPVNNSVLTAFQARRPAADLHLAVTVTPLFLDQPATYTATVTNLGPSAATNTIFRGLEFVFATHPVESFMSSQGTCLFVPGGGLAPLCALGTLAPGASATVTVVARPSIVLFQGSSQATASVTVQGGAASEEQDPFVANNTVNMTVEVRRNIDTTPPAITVTAPVSGATYTLNQVVSASYSCADAVGVSTCQGTVPNGGAIDTSTVGPKTFTVTATDAAGNQSQEVRQYSVVLPDVSTCLGEPSRQILAPINADGSSRFARGLPVLARFRVCGPGGQSLGTPGLVTSFRLVRSTTAAGAVVAADQPVPTFFGSSTIVWNQLTRSWLTLIDTRRLARSATHEFRITLNDGGTIDFTFFVR